MSRAQVIEADLAWTGARFERGIRIAVNGDGVIERTGELDSEPTLRLRHRALLPGFVNIHSHAFQRGLRGLGETFPPGGTGSFWTWREAMYDLVERLDEPLLYDLSHLAFTEMLRAGITTVGEFHYAHHSASAADFALDAVVLRAAQDAGIRMVLLETCYETGGIGQPLQGAQRRFETTSPDEFWGQVDRLKTAAASAGHSVGVAAHSIRAVPLPRLIELHEEACRRGLVFHMHVEEQPLEIEQCLEAYHKTPMALIIDSLAVNPLFTAIHCTHAAASDMNEFLIAGGNVGICPLTEANLGDGLANVPQILREGGRICLGTDSNARLSFTEEMRMLEYGQRLRHQRRGICTDDAGRNGAVLLEAATINGARSLGIRAGRLAANHLADFVAIDLEAPILDGWADDTLLESLVFGSGNEAIAAVCVGGRWIETAGLSR